MNISHWASYHRRSILFLVVAIALAGFFSGFKLPVSLFPKISFPRIVLSLETGDRPADQMVIAVTRPVEQAVRSVLGVVNLRSTTSRGSAEVSINFEWGSDMISSMLQVNSAVNQILSDLPSGTRFTVRRMDPTVFPVVAYSLTSDTKSLVQLRDLGQYQLLPLLSSIEGIASVKVLGGKEAEYRVEIDPEKMMALDLSFSDVAQSLSASNVLQAVGRLEDHYKLYLMLSDTRILSITNIKDTVLRSGADGLVRLEDIANIYFTVKPQWKRVTADGHDAVLVQIYQQPGGNTVEISANIRKRLQDYQSKLPPDVNITNWYDQSQLITSSAKSVRDAIAIGIILSALILLIFLRNIKITLIAVFIVPTVLASTALVLNVLNMSFNIMTLGGMAAAVGLIVDDTIVMIEHIIRRVREKKGNISLIVKLAASEFTSPLVGSSTATIIIFIPLAFLSGVTGAFFKALSLTMVSSLFISFLLAWLAVPLIAKHLIHQNDSDKKDNGPVFSRFKIIYRQLMHHIMSKPSLILIGIIPIVFMGLFAFKQVGSGFMPYIDEGGFILDYRSQSGTSLTETDRLLRQVETILRNNPAIDTYSRRTGVQLGGGLSEANEGDFFIQLKLFPRPAIDVVMDQVRGEIEEKIPGLEIEMALLMEDLIGDLTAVPQPIEIKLFTDNLTDLLTIAPGVADAIRKINGVVDVKDGIVLAGDAINIIVDRDKAALEGIDPDLVTQQLNAWFNGLVTTQVQENIKLIGVRLWVPESERSKTSAINTIWLRAADGHHFPLKRIAQIKTELGQPQINRDNLKRMVAVTGRISGRDMGSTILEIKKVLANDDLLPFNMYYELGGLYQQQEIAFNGLIEVFIAALALIFVLLLFMYEDFYAAIAIIISPLLAMPAVFIGLWITDIELSITAIMGMTMIIGIVTEVSIFYFSEYYELLKNGVDRSDALIFAGSNRMRPITMTTFSAILALLPLAMEIGQGSAMQQPLAVAIISGLLIQIPLVLIVMPMIYHLLLKIKYTV